MDFNKFIGISYTDDESAVGADSSCPPPIYRPRGDPQHIPVNFLKLISFFANYSQMARSIGGLDAAGEWPALRALLPKLHDKNVLDLGCGFGWHCRYAREHQA